MTGYVDLRAKLGGLVNGPGFIMAPGVVDPLTARQVELAGFDAVYLSGGGYARSQGFPDMGLLTMTEITQWVARVVDSVTIPVIADADTGYGNALNVIRAVTEFERTGAAAIQIEDQMFPKRCGHYDGKSIVSRDEMVGKIKAAVDTRRDERFLIIARTDSRPVYGFDDAVDRLGSYIEAGADIGFFEAPQTVAEIQEVPRRLTGPLLINIFEGGKTPVVEADALQEMGYKIGIYPSQTHRASIRASQRMLDLLRSTGGRCGGSEDLVTFAERETLVGSTAWRELETRYLDMVVQDHR